MSNQKYIKKAGKKQTRDDFINNAKAVHGDLYDYSLVEYVNSKTKVKIICKHHGEFLQAPVKHLSGQKCKHCNENKIGSDEYIRKFNSINTECDGTIINIPDEKINARTLITFKCCECGDLSSRRASRVYHEEDRLFCRSCSSVRQRLTEDEYLERFRKLFGDKYNYSKMNYNGNCNSKIVVICPKHGEFKISPSKHSSGRGCSECALDNRRPDNPTQAERYKEQYLNEYCCVYLLDFNDSPERFK